MAEAVPAVSGGRSVTVPVHAGRDVSKGTLRSVLSIMGMSVEELRQLL